MMISMGVFLLEGYFTDREFMGFYSPELVFYY